MLAFPLALHALNTPDFKEVLKHEIEQLDAALLPLQQGLTRSGVANADSLSAMILGVTELPQSLQVTAGLFYTGIIPGCSCADDPTPIDEINEYCEVRFDIDRQTGAATVTLL